MAAVTFGLAADAVRHDGTATPARFRYDAGRVLVRSADREYPLSDFALIRYLRPSPLPPSAAFRLEFGDGGSIGISEPRLDGDQLRFRTGWGTTAAVRRRHVAAITRGPRLPRHGVEPSADEIQTSDGDQWFGTIERLDGSGVVIRMPVGSRSLSWDRLAGVFPARPEPITTTDTGEWLRVRLWSAGELDDLTGVVTAIDNNQIQLRCPRIGTVALPIDRIADFRSTHAGRRVVIDDSSRPLRTPRPYAVDIDSPPKKATLTVETKLLPGTRCEVVLNGRVIGSLSSDGPRSRPRATTGAFDLSREALTIGNNSIQIRAIGDPAGSTLTRLRLDLE
jgi:hypothetical protein